MIVSAFRKVQLINHDERNSSIELWWLRLHLCWHLNETHPMLSNLRCWYCWFCITSYKIRRRQVQTYKHIHILKNECILTNALLIIHINSKVIWTFYHFRSLPLFHTVNGTAFYYALRKLTKMMNIYKSTHFTIFSLWKCNERR